MNKHIKLPWQPIETAPKDENLLVCMSGGLYIGSLRETGEGYFWGIAHSLHGDLASCDCYCDDDYQPDYWLPLNPPVK